MRFCFLFLFFISTACYSQRFDGGVFAGLITSQLDGDHHAGYDKVGYTFGGFVKTKIDEKWGAQLEIKFIQKGSKGADSIGGTFNYYRSQLNYIELPVFINRTYKEKFFGEVGLGVAYLISAYEDKDAYGYVEAYPVFNKFELSATAGFGYKFSDNLFVSLRFSYSILPVRDVYPGYYRYIERGQYNNVLSLALYYKI